MYKTARNKVTSEIKRSKATYFNNLSTSKINSPRLWKHLNHLLSRTNRESVKSLLVNGSELTNKTEIAEVMNHHFISATECLQSPLTYQSNQSQLVNPNSSFTFTPVYEEEVINIISSLHPNKSSGLSEINIKSFYLTSLPPLLV